MNNFQLANKHLEKLEDEMIDFLRELVSINSKEDSPEERKPFGEGVDRAFRYVLKKGEEAGFTAKNIDGYGGHLEMGNICGAEKKEEENTPQKIMGILCHLDVVPTGEGWTFDPFKAEIHDGKLYGRGAIDDKGPTAAAFFAMKAIKEAGLESNMKNRVRLILGLDEETNWKGMDYYLSCEERPDFGFTPDGSFPLINREKGIFVFKLVKKLEKTRSSGLVLKSLKGGDAPNMVADWARAVLSSPDKDDYNPIMSEGEDFKKEKNCNIKIKRVGKSLEIKIKGKSAHGSLPEKGENALCLLMDFLGRLPVQGEETGDFIRFFNQYIGYNTKGEDLKLNFNKNGSEETSLCVGQAHIGQTEAMVTINLRTPVDVEEHKVYEILEPVLAKENIGIIKEKFQPPLYVEKDSPLVQTLLSAYRTVTGDKKGEPLAIGGGTYARALDNFVAFGAVFPHEEEIAHWADEYIDLQSLKIAAKIYCRAIIELCM